MHIAPSNGIELYYETHGDRSDPAMLLINGFSSQINGWLDGFRESLAERGRYVISFDNRDVGLSTHLDGVEVHQAALAAGTGGGGDRPTVPYLLADFASDAVGLLDHLQVDAAHIAGSSMGGMIVQQLAIDHPDRALSMTSIMSTTGEADYFESSPEAEAALLGVRPTDREEFIADAVIRREVSCGRRYWDPAEHRRLIAESYDRSFDPDGLTRQLAAIRASGNRADGLRSLDVPTLVIHGAEDALIRPKGGLRTAELVPHANLLLIGDMGHDLPRPLWPVIIDAIISHTEFANR